MPEKQHVDLFISDMAMFHTSGHDEELALHQPDVAVPALHSVSPVDHQKQPVLVVLLMPDELALEFYHFNVLPVQLAHDLGIPLIVEGGKFLPNVQGASWDSANVEDQSLDLAQGPRSQAIDFRVSVMACSRPKYHRT